MVEFLGYRFAFNADDFEQRVTAAAVKLGLVESNDLDEDETEDLVELAADGRIEEARSPLGRYLVRHWEQLSLVKGESLVYRLRKLVFRGAWLDHRVKEGLLDVDWDEAEAEFGYRDPAATGTLLEFGARSFVARGAVQALSLVRARLWMYRLGKEGMHQTAEHSAAALVSEARLSSAAGVKVLRPAAERGTSSQPGASEARSWSLLGALLASWYRQQGGSLSMDFVAHGFDARALGEATQALDGVIGTASLESWNDDPARTFDEVIATIDRAAELLASSRTG